MLHSKTGTLQPQTPFDFEQSLAFLGAFPPMHGEQQIADRSLTTAVSIDRQPVVFRVHASGTTDTPEIAYTLYAHQPISPTLAGQAADRIAFFLSLDDDLRPLYALGEHDPSFAPVIQQNYGLHQVKFLTPFENACWALLSVRVPMALSLKVKQRLSEEIGAALDLEGKTYHAFPEPAQLLESADQLAGIVNNPRKTDYLQAAARAFDSVDEHWLRTAPSDDVEAWLLNIKGIGAWSARFVMIRGLGRMDRMSVGEQRVIDVARERYGRDLSEQQIAEIAARYGAQQGYWAYYLRAA
ncbi:MAG: DNA-3-methyladenine glycosylase 2 family protein [Chloroflexota bacterium]